MIGLLERLPWGNPNSTLAFLPALPGWAGHAGHLSLSGLAAPSSDQRKVKTPGRFFDLSAAFDPFDQETLLTRLWILTMAMGWIAFGIWAVGGWESRGTMPACCWLTPSYPVAFPSLHLGEGRCGLCSSTCIDNSWICICTQADVRVSSLTRVLSQSHLPARRLIEICNFPETAAGSAPAPWLSSAGCEQCGLCSLRCFQIDFRCTSHSVSYIQFSLIFFHFWLLSTARPWPIG